MCDPAEKDKKPDEPQTDAPEATEEDLSCVCASLCDKLKKKLGEIDTKEVFDTTMAEVRKRPLLGVIVAGMLGYFFGRLTKKLW